MHKVGLNSYTNNLKVSDHPESTLRIGKYCSIAPDVRIFLGDEHRTDWVTTFPFQVEGNRKSKGDVLIGNDVWIGFGATILSGVEIGDGAVIGARAVVAKDVKPYEIVAGNPARHIRFRFDKYAIELLLKLKWWDLPENEVQALIPMLTKAPDNEVLRSLCK
jgi:acetyltransferase-like isoleucine patch superfamily enzyme